MTILNKTNGAKIVWDKENDRPLLNFSGGPVITENVEVARKAKALGYEVEGYAECAPETEEETTEEDIKEEPVVASAPRKSKKAGE